LFIPLHNYSDQVSSAFFGYVYERHAPPQRKRAHTSPALINKNRQLLQLEEMSLA
jgi:hypothetical protein